MPYLGEKILLCLVWVTMLFTLLHGKALSESVSPEGIEWYLSAMGSAEVTPLPGGKRPSLFLNPANKKAGGFAGCNHYFSQYELNGSSLKFGLIGATRRACPDAESNIEWDFFAALEKTSAWEIKEGKLALMSGADVLARFAINNVNDAEPDLDSLTIHSTVYKTSPVTLTRGEFHKPAAPDSASDVIMKLTDKRAFGTLGGESVGAVVVVTTLDGTGTFYELALLIHSAQGWMNTDTVLLGDRVQVHSVAMENDHIAVVMTTHAPQDPMCCPTLKIMKRFALQDKRLLAFSDEISQTQLIGTVWQWKYSRYNNDTQTVPAEPRKYTVQFLDEGKLNVKADCNLKGGTYSIVSQ